MVNANSLSRCSKEDLAVQAECLASDLEWTLANLQARDEMDHQVAGALLRAKAAYAAVRSVTEAYDVTP